MKLTFLGTRGNIASRSRRHRMHSSLLVSYYDTRVMIDCGEDWLDGVRDLAPDAIVVTHAHPDHAWGLRRGAPSEVYATEASWQEKERVSEAIFTHCGSEIVEGDERSLGAKIRRLANERGVEVDVAHDDMGRVLR